MVRRVLAAFQKEVSGLHEAAFLLGFSAIVSQLLALIRDRLFASTFGAGPELDVYYAAFRIPDFIYITIASFVSLTVLIPFLNAKLNGSGSLEESKRFISGVFTVFMFVITVVITAVFFLIPYLSPFIAPGFTEAQNSELITLTRVLLLSPLLLGISNLLGSVTQLFRRFFVYAASPVLYNIGIISGIIFLYPTYGLIGIGYGVIIGAFLHAAVQIPSVVFSGLIPRFTLQINWTSIKDVVMISLPRTLSLSVTHIVLLILVAAASFIDKGSISVFTFAFNLQSVPLAVIGISYSLAAFPTLTRSFQEGSRRDFVTAVRTAIKHILFWSISVTVLLIVLRAQIVRVILGSGEFTWSDTKLVAAALALFSVSIAAQGIVLLLVRGFYASGETRLPLYVNLGSAIFSICIALGTLWLFYSAPITLYIFEQILRVSDIEGTAVLALPFGYSIGMLINAAALWFFFSREYPEGRLSVGRSLGQSVLSSVVAGFVAYLMLNVLDDVFDLNTFIGIFSQGFIAGLMGIFAGALTLAFLGNEEFKNTREALKHRFWRAKPFAPDLEEM